MPFQAITSHPVDFSMTGWWRSWPGGNPEALGCVSPIPPRFAPFSAKTSARGGACFHFRAISVTFYCLHCAHSHAAQTPAKASEEAINENLCQHAT